MTNQKTATNPKKSEPQFPIYIPSKSRWDSRLTVKTLEKMSVPYKIIVEEQQYEQYAAVIDPANIMILDPQYQRNYDAFDSLGMTKSKGSGPARNFAWDHSISIGAKWHWIMDDNIRWFYRFNKNMKIPVADGTILRCMEDFALRFKNVSMVGPHYDYFIPRKKSKAPITLNTRIFSCNLIRNDVPFRWRGRYNEDVDLSIRMLKSKWCLILFNAFLQGKTPTQVMKGGNMDELYVKGTTDKSDMLYRMHPDIVKVVKRYGRVHHYVDYTPFANNKLVYRDDIEIPTGTDNYGMALKVIEKAP